MTQEQYEYRHAIIMQRIYHLEDTFSDGRPKYPRSLRAAMKELDELEEEWRKQND